MLNLSGLFSRNRGDSHSANIRAVLDRVCRRFAPRLSARMPLESPPYRRKVLFETLEPRLLMSADFNPVAPMGSLIQQASQSGNLASPGTSVSYTLALDANQQISVLLSPQDAGLGGTIELFDTDGTSLLGTATAGAGQAVLLDSVVGANAGDYTLKLTSASGSGNFSADFFLNATV